MLPITWLRYPSLCMKKLEGCGLGLHVPNNPYIFHSHSILHYTCVGYVYLQYTILFHSSLQATAPMLATCTYSTPRTTLSCGHLCSCCTLHIALSQTRRKTPPFKSFLTTPHLPLFILVSTARCRGRPRTEPHPLARKMCTY